MEAILAYLIHTHVYLLVFAAGYFLLIRNYRAPGFKRMFLLASVFLSLLLASLPSMPLVFDATPAQQFQAIQLPELVVRAAAGSTHFSDAITAAVSRTMFFWPIVLITGCFILMLMLGRLFRIVLLISRNRVIDQEGMHIVLLNSDESPFSFFRYVFVSADMFGQPHFHRVMAHERAHFLRGHSVDVLVMEAFRVVAWLNPAFHYLNKELRAQHEFEADMIACRHIGIHDYQTTLLNYTLSGKLIPLTNPFNVSLIKQRIMMMNHKTNILPAGLWLKTLAFVPFLLLAVFVQSCQEQAKEEAVTTIEAVEEEVKVNYDEDQIFTVVEQPPVFSGGEEARIQFLVENLRYPASARELGVQGTVYVSFIVRFDGTIDDVKVLRGAGHELEVRYAGSEHDIEALRVAAQAIDDEAMRVVEMMPNWTPGSQRGEAVSVQFNMPIRFTLN